MSELVVNRIVATLLPYVFALFVLGQRRLVTRLARMGIHLMRSPKQTIPEAVARTAIAICEYTYQHVTFFTAMTTACVTAITHTLLGGNPLLAVLVAVYLVGVIYYWFSNWVSLTPDPDAASTRLLKRMNAIEVLTIIVLMSVSLWYNVIMPYQMVQTVLFDVLK